LLVVVIIVLVLLFLFLQFFGGGSFIRKIDRTLPPAGTAPYQVETPTRIIYAESAGRLSDSSVEITGWYEKIDEKWVRHDSTLVLDISMYSEIKVVRREQ